MKLTVIILALICGLISPLSHLTEACSSRAVPKPRPSTSSSSSIGAPPLPKTTTTPTTTTTVRTTTVPTTTTTTTTTPRPNITFPTYKCPATYDAWYCLNEATCFSVKIGDSIMYNCECANGFMGPRCEYKELDGSYLPKRPRPILEKASIASGATCALLFMLLICLTLYLRYDQKTRLLEEQDEYDSDVEVDAYACSYECRYCDDARCLAAANGTSLIANTEKYSVSSLLRQHIEAIPITFAIKRSMKL